ncbi:MAG: hypothetical protein GX823_05240 [Clostridiales bacterium]|nr:hypothetical protein [Clostridiales bacterium]
MKRSNAIITLIAIIAAVAAVAALVIVFRDRLEVFLAEMHDKFVAAKEDMFEPDEYSDYADVD